MLLRAVTAATLLPLAAWPLAGPSGSAAPVRAHRVVVVVGNPVAATTASAPETGTDPADLARPELPATGSAPAVPAAAALAAALLLAGLALLRRRRG
ncbi:LPXTG cell wall anchor domain-containing protein [Kitasatospora gansuensis]